MKYLPTFLVPEDELRAAREAKGSRPDVSWDYVLFPSPYDNTTFDQCDKAFMINQTGPYFEEGTLQDFRHFMNTNYPGWADGVAEIVPYPAQAEPPACHCQNLLAGHDEWCAYHKQDYEDPRTRHDLWGIKRQDAKTRAEINAEHLSFSDRYGPKQWALLKVFGGKP
jgi:hypothetical protein